MAMIDAKGIPEPPLEALRELARAAAQLDDLRRHQVAQARQAGATWDQIGDALGMSRQAAWEFFSKRATEALAAAAAANDDLSDEEALELSVQEVKAVRRERQPGR